MNNQHILLTNVLFAIFLALPTPGQSMEEDCCRRICLSYDSFERTLAETYDLQFSSHDTNLYSTVLTIAAIRSRYSLDRLMRDVKLKPNLLAPDNGNYLCVPPLVGAGGLMAPEMTCPLVRPIMDCYVPVSLCASLVCTTRTNVQDWVAWQAYQYVGIRLHGNTEFRRILRLSCGENTVIPQDFPEVNATTNLPFSAIVSNYRSFETNLYNWISFAATNQSVNVPAVHTAGHIRSNYCKKLLLDNIEMTTNALQEVCNQSVAVVDSFPAVKALAEIGMPFCESLDLIEKADDGSLRERLLVRLAELSHGCVFTNYVHSFGNGPTNRYSRIISEYGL